MSNQPHPYENLRREADEMHWNSPSVLRYTPILWVLRVVLNLLSLAFLVVLITTFTDDLWQWWYRAIDIPTETDMVTRGILVTARVLLIALIVISRIAAWLAGLVIRRNWYIVTMGEQLDKTLKALKPEKKEDTDD